ncbi:MAG: deoxyhypusine synthase [Chlamydiae bacterium]|nr:deoxyhypusine synthase [Chlamydiota bacterium]
MSIKAFMRDNFRHFNAATCVEAAEEYVQQLKKGNKMIISLAGAMSTAELGITLAEMIRKGAVHGISCTGANLEEDIFNLVAHSKYSRIPKYRSLTAQEEKKLFSEDKRRVTDTCIPEDTAMIPIGEALLAMWKKAEEAQSCFFPYEFMYQVLRSEMLKPYYEIDPKDSWVLAACEKNIPIFTPGWEDSTTGNMFVARVMKQELKTFNLVKSGTELMAHLKEWYEANSQDNSIGFFQIGGGIAGDFSICVVPMIQLDLEKKCRLWSYFCQISDSTTSYGSYSGAVPNEKITWCKLDVDTPSFIIESDATIVAPLIFTYILESL